MARGHGDAGAGQRRELFRRQLTEADEPIDAGKRADADEDTRGTVRLKPDTTGTPARLSAASGCRASAVSGFSRTMRSSVRISAS